MTVRQITKLQIAVEQLEDALTAYFGGRYHSATVLAGAAESLLAGYVLKQAGTPAFHHARSSITKIANGLKLMDDDDTGDEPSPTTEKDIGDLLNHAYNNSKHAGTKDHLVSMDPQFEAYELIDRAILNFDALLRSGEEGVPNLELVQRFREEGTREVRSEEAPDGEA